MAVNDKRFSFVSLGISGDTFGVVRFSGTEGLSGLYEFEVELVSSDAALDLNEVIQNPARLTILRNGANISYNGMVSEFEQQHQVGSMCFYRARLVPGVWRLTQTPYNQVFLHMTVPDIIRKVLDDAGFKENEDFELYLGDEEEDYLEWEYVCQYRETHMAFLQRLMEREGIYYFFSQETSREKLIITDTGNIHTPMDEGETLHYSPPSGLDEKDSAEIVKSFSCRQRAVPASVYQKDHNFGKKDLQVEGSAEVFDEGNGEAYFFGDHFTTPEEGERLTRIRAGEYRCRMQRFHGETTVPYLRPGYLFFLERHFRDAFNQKYLTVSLTHQGSQASFMLAGLSGALSGREMTAGYWNTVSALPAGIAFRPARKTEKPRFYGTLNARIDAAGDGKYAELDEEGRYKVILPFDRSGRSGGKASAWIRMMQPYAGPNQGMHFPLHKGAEVLLTFIDGDPDRPVIAGAVPGPEGVSPVTSENQTKAVIHTGRSPVEDAGEDENDAGGNNYIEFQDEEENESIRIHSPGDLWLEAQNRYAEYHGNDPPGSLSREDAPTISQMMNDFGPEGDYNPTGMLDRHSREKQGDFFSDVFKNAHVHVSSLDTVNLQEGNIYDFGGYWNYNLGNCYVEEHLDQRGPLNQTHDTDLLDKGGPYWTKVDWRKAVPEAPTEAPSEADIKLEGHWDDSDGGTDVWVNKTFGNAYTYAKGKTIEVTEGDSLEIQHGGRHVEMGFREDGSIKSWSWSEGGISKEKKWTGGGTLTYKSHSDASAGISSEYKYCRTTGNMLSYSSAHQGGNAVHSFDFKWANTASAAFTFAAGTSFDFKMAANLDMAVYAAMNTSIKAYAAGNIDLSTHAGLSLGLSAYAGTSIDISAYLAGKLDISAYMAIKIAMELSAALSLEVKAGMAIAIEMDARNTGKIEIDASDGSCKVKAGGMLEAEKTPNLKAALDVLRVRM